MNDFVKELCLGNTRRSLRNGLKSGFAVLNRGDATITHAGNRLKRSVLVRFYSPADWESINQHDREFSRVLTATTRYLDLLKLYDGVITPDCSMQIRQAPCLQQTNTYMNRAVGYFLQRNGIPVIPNIRWSDESSFDYCFLGVYPGSIVCISTHGCIQSKEQKRIYKTGLEAMLEAIRPCQVLVHTSSQVVKLNSEEVSLFSTDCATDA